MTDRDIIGWRVGNKIHYNKWSAIIDYVNDPRDFSFYYYDNSWDQYNWAEEPDVDIKFLEHQHCEYLRNNNEILILAYSGGIDSHSILNRFIESKQHLDYILCFSTSNDINHSSEFEIFFAKKELEKLKSLLPDTKFLFVNEEINVIDRVKYGNGIQTFDGDNIEYLNMDLRFHHYGWAERLKLEHPKIYDNLKSSNGKIIIGANKPAIELKNDNCYWYTPIDKFDENVQDSKSHEFFWTSANPLLHIKQCHLAKRWLKRNKLKNAETIIKSKNSATFLDFNFAIGRDPPAHPVFAVKNCFGDHTNMDFLNQYCGTKHNVHIETCKSDVFVENLKKLDQFIESFSKKHPILVNYENKSIDVYGWLGKPRCLGN